MTLNVVPIIFNAILQCHDQENMDININIPLKWTIIIIIIIFISVLYSSHFGLRLITHFNLVNILESCNSMSNVF